MEAARRQFTKNSLFRPVYFERSFVWEDFELESFVGLAIFGTATWGRISHAECTFIYLKDQKYQQATIISPLQDKISSPLLG